MRTPIDTTGVLPMSFNDLFVSQNMGMTPAPQMPPEIRHFGDVVGQYLDKKRIQPSNGMVEGILSGRFAPMEPTLEDASLSINQTAQSFLAPHLVKPISPLQQAAERNALELSPYSELANIQSKFGASKLANSGGATGILMNRLRAENPNLSDSDALYMIQTGFRQGTQLDQNGNIIAAPGAADAKRALKFGEQSGSEEAKLQYAAPIAGAKESGKEAGQKGALLNSMSAKLPQLLSTVDQLRRLGKTATYTMAGRALDSTTRQLGFPVRQGAQDRAEYISLVDNQILPLLRDTFGAQFTEREGASLKITLGDPNKSPEEKDAVLRSFINQKIGGIQSLQRETGAPVSSEQELMSNAGGFDIDSFLKEKGLQ